MKLSEFQQLIDRHHDSDRRDDPDVMIAIKLPWATVGGTPVVPVKLVMHGFDWDRGKFMIFAEEPLTKHDGDFEKKFKEVHEKWGWADYENRNLKKEIKKLQKLLAEKSK